MPLDGVWQFQTNGAPANAWEPVALPASLEAHAGIHFDGTVWYRKTVVPPPIPPRHRLLLEFQAVATQAEVWWNQTPLGSHLGGWTPFRFDVTQHANAAGPKPVELRVRVDEKVGHNTQGFLPIVQPHFGGIWQSVRWIVVPETYVDDLELLARGNPGTGRIELEFPLIGPQAASTAAVLVRHRLRGRSRWHQARVIPLVARRESPAGDPATSAQAEASVVRLEVTVEQPRRWSPAEPNLYELEIELPAPREETADVLRTRAAFRSIETRGRQLLLNGSPLTVRGLLNWGYYPASERLELNRPTHPNPQSPIPNPQSQISNPQSALERADLSPNPGEALFRRDLEFARARGFNLMKFCLWVPPRRCLELADEMGMLTWMEYPTWHPQLTQEHLDNLRREFFEFFRYDRNHPSVILRSLTCETGPGADLAVIRELYNLAHAMIPGAVIEDDSSWIQWNRISDIYDDHPYGNNHTWVPTLRRLEDYIAERDPRPLVLGEAMAADTWPKTGDYPRLHENAALARRLEDGRQKAEGSPETESQRVESTNDPSPLSPLPFAFPPYWFPGAFTNQLRWLDRMRAISGPVGLEQDQLLADSLRYGLLMRKYQAETFRREIPTGGYVISVIRDFPTASMGLIDYLGRPKWSALEWTWHRDTACLLKTENDRRSFASGEDFRAQILVHHAGTTPIKGGRLTATLKHPDGTVLLREVCRDLQAAPGSLTTVLDFRTALPHVEQPCALTLQTELKSKGEIHPNEWTFWLVPRQTTEDLPPLRLHRSLPAELAKTLFPTALDEAPIPTANPREIVVASRFDDSIVRHLDQGGRVLLLPDGETASFPLADHWFLRGAPVLPGHPLIASRESIAPTQPTTSLASRNRTHALPLPPGKSRGEGKPKRLEQPDAPRETHDAHADAPDQFPIPKSQIRNSAAGQGEEEQEDPPPPPIPRNFLLDLQSFDLASRVIPNIPYLESLNPILLLWDTHDLRTVKTHGLVFETRAGNGRLLVSALRHQGADNAAGRWLLHAFLRHLSSGLEPRHGLTDAQWQRIREKIHEEKIALTDAPWRFRPDPNNAGLHNGWHKPETDDTAANGWSDIKVGQHWEGQGFPALDHWAWYRLTITVPANWKDRPVYLSFEGVDDMYELYVNGDLVTKRGDIDTRKDTFSEKHSHDITRRVQPGEKAVIAVRVYDWYGAGGIFRPVTLGNTALAAEGEILK